MDDVRFEWMKDVIYRFLSIDINDRAFEELVNRDENAEILRNVINGTEDSQKRIFFFKEIVEEEIEREDTEVEKQEESSKAETTHSSHSVRSDSEDIMDVVEVADKDKDIDETEFDSPKENGSMADDDYEDANKSEIADDKKDQQGKSTTSLMLIVKKIRLSLCMNISHHIPSRSYVYFLLRKAAPLPPMESFEEAQKRMPQYFELGCFNHHPIICIDKLITSLYVPLFENETSNPHLSTENYPINEEQISLLLTDINKEMKEFTISTKHIISQIEKPFMFTLLEIPSGSSVEDLAHEGEFISDAQEILQEWSSVVSDLYMDVSKRSPPETSLQQETNFWKEQKLKLSICCDQLSHRTIRQTIEILSLADSDIREFEMNVKNVEEELNKVTNNVNYLLLMEPNLKTLQPGAPFEEARKSLQDIFMILKIIWVQSEYYKDVTNMCRLIRGIAILLKERVKEDEKVDALFRKPLPEISTIVTGSMEILKYWKELYLSECEKVKRYGGSYWWGFDIRLFFDETDYIISICTDLLKISQALQELYNIFNTNLRFFVENTKDLDILENRIFGMTALIQYAEFDVFDPKCKAEWDRIKCVFFRDVKCYEDEMKTYIGKMFQTSLRWEDAYIFAQSFDKFTVSPAIKEFIVKSRADMLKQYTREIVETENHFLALEREPPKYEGIPPSTSAILWVRDLLSRITSPMVQISENSDLSGKDKEVRKRFKKAEHVLKTYEKDKFEAWKSTASENLSKFLQTHILKKFQSSTSKTITTNKLEEAVSYQVYFPIYLEEVSIEAKLLEQMGYEIPVFIRNIILQEKSFYQHRNKIKLILEDLKSSLSDLTIEEVSIMGIPIANLCSVLDLGVNSIQWEATDIKEFLKKSKQAVDIFRGLVAQIKNVVSEIDKQIEHLSACDLFQFATIKNKIPTCEEFFGDATLQMEAKTEKMIKIYTSLEPLLRKLEKISCNTTTGKSEQMKEYYSACEEKVLNSLVKMMLLNLEYFKDEVLDRFVFPYTEAAFKSKDELVTSSLIRIKLIFVTFMKNALESTRKLIRWLDGSCIQSSPFYIKEMNFHVEFSYYLDLSMHTKVKELMLSIINMFFVYVDDIDTT